jgi:RNA polymerase sigma-70 factor, ECF subfamily
MVAIPHTRRATALPERGDAPPSFDAIFRSYARTVGRWAERLGGPGVEADEAVQEVFVTVNRRLASFRGTSSLATWLFQITARVVANQRRAVRRRRARSVTLSATMAERTISLAPGPNELLEAREAAERFYRALDRLKENHRQAVVLFELEQMSTEQIGVLLGRPPATVRVWLHRARAAFMKAWESQTDTARKGWPGEQGE